MAALFPRTAVRRIFTTPRAVSLACNTTRGKATLPDLPYDYSALEPHISGRIMELHHARHHQTYVNGLNAATEQLGEALAAGDAARAVALQPLLKFHGGGHVNHSLFWRNLAPAGRGGGGEPEGALATAITKHFTSPTQLITHFNAELAALQGSGWTWLVWDAAARALAVQSHANQDPVVGGRFTPLLGIDAWEHAYYLDYENRKADYFKAVWNVVNWAEVGRRFEEVAEKAKAS